MGTDNRVDGYTQALLKMLSGKSDAEKKLILGKWTEDIGQGPEGNEVMEYLIKLI